MVQLVKPSQFHSAPLFATVISEKFFRTNGDYPNGFGKWIFTNPECTPLEVIGYYSSACNVAKKHFKQEGVRYCYVSLESHNLQSPKRPRNGK
jgi:hypothetical protein